MAQKLLFLFPKIRQYCRDHYEHPVATGQYAIKNQGHKIKLRNGRR